MVSCATNYDLRLPLSGIMGFYDMLQITLEPNIFPKIHGIFPEAEAGRGAIFFMLFGLPSPAQIAASTA